MSDVVIPSVTDYKTAMELLAQQKRSRLEPYVQAETFVGETGEIMEQVGIVVPSLKTARHADTPITDTPRERRWVDPSDYIIADLLDTEDKLRALINLESGMAMAQSAGMERIKDDVIIQGAFGTNRTGKSGATNVTFNAAQEIDNGALGLTIDQIREARFLFENADVDLDAYEGMGGRYGACLVLTPKQKQQLLSTTETTNQDYGTVGALVNGTIDTFYGFKILTSTRLPGAPGYNGALTIPGGEDWALCYAADGLGYGIWNPLTVEFDRRADKQNALQVMAKMTIGATRLQEPKVLKLISDNTK